MSCVLCVHVCASVRVCICKFECVRMLWGVDGWRGARVRVCLGASKRRVSVPVVLWVCVGARVRVCLRSRISVCFVHA